MSLSILIVEPILVLGRAVSQYFRCDLKSDVLDPDLRPSALPLGDELSAGGSSSARRLCSCS